MLVEYSVQTKGRYFILNTQSSELSKISKVSNTNDRNLFLLKLLKYDYFTEYIKHHLILIGIGF